MKGYVSFILVFISLVFLSSLLALNLAAKQYDFSKAVAVERTYETGMDAKVSAKTLVCSGALAGFREYDESHSLESCSACLPCTSSPVPCNAEECSKCFIAEEASRSAESGAKASLETLKMTQDSREISFSAPDFVANLVFDESAKNKYALESVTIAGDLDFSIVSDSLKIQEKTKIPAGRVIFCERPALH